MFDDEVTCPECGYYGYITDDGECPICGCDIEETEGEIRNKEEREKEKEEKEYLKEKEIDEEEIENLTEEEIDRDVEEQIIHESGDYEIDLDDLMDDDEEICLRKEEEIEYEISADEERDYLEYTRRLKEITEEEEFEENNGYYDRYEGERRFEQEDEEDDI
ncbi:MAG: hypothetical protein BWY32_01660 [bacterium ADurb.Bin243]|nr:MAG: hypothetical protein BWY32_01660 [bacterium ADurb.Bin243]